MGKVFTITEGLENLGAMKTGGQGSVYKGRRIGEIITAIKLLPTPIYNESLEDKNYRDFQNEVQKLKRVNEEPNPHVVTILSSGVTDSGNFPFIEMEYIEGPDLEDLLKPPHDPVFTIKEILKIADQLSDALAHCHKMDVRHGDVKSNNVKFNSKTGNYVLLDFGLSAMSDEQRRTSLRHAGAIEFMAPEQNEGHMLFQTDVYSFGVIMFELIAGQVPFPLHDRGETARNNVRLSHMETPPPDMLQIRQQNLPELWPADKKEREMHIPEWLVSMVYKCLEKAPENRYKTGVELYESFVTNSSKSAKSIAAGVGSAAVLSAGTNEKLLAEKEQLKNSLIESRHQLQLKEKEILELKEIITASQNSSFGTASPVYREDRQQGVSKTAFITLLILTIGLAAFAAYSYFGRPGVETPQYADSTQNKIDSILQADSAAILVQQEEKTNTRLAKDTAGAVVTIEENNNEQSDESSAGEDTTTVAKPTPVEPTEGQKSEPTTSRKYQVISKAFFHDNPVGSSRRDAFIVHWNKAVLTPLGETDDFIYIEYTNEAGQTSKGWLRKADLKLIN